MTDDVMKEIEEIMGNKPAPYVLPLDVNVSLTNRKLSDEMLKVSTRESHNVGRIGVLWAIYRDICNSILEDCTYRPFGNIL